MAVNEQYYQELYIKYQDVLTMPSIRKKYSLSRMEIVDALNQFYDINRKDAKEFIDQKNEKESKIMRIQTVDCKSRYKARKLCFWAAKIAKVEDGYICFESSQDYKIWKAQI